MSARKFFGFALVLLGSILLLKSIGILDFSWFKVLEDYWPLGLILAGVLFLFRLRLLGGIALLLTLCWALASVVDVNVGEQREFTEIVDVQGATSLAVDIDFGAGQLEIADASQFKYKIVTSSTTDPTVATSKVNEVLNVEMNRGQYSFSIGDKVVEEWLVGLVPLPTDLSLDYGAADVSLDLENLMINNLDINSGAASTVVTFGQYPTKATIDAGASSVVLRYPKDMGVVLNVDSGLSSVDANTLVRREGMYYSPSYDQNGQNIEISVDAGASSIEVEEY